VHARFWAAVLQETPVRTMAFTHNGNFLVSGDDAGTVRRLRWLLLPALSLQHHSCPSLAGGQEALTHAATKDSRGRASA
jgi:hypothetical protein